MSIHRQAARKDGNHRACVNAFRALGCSVEALSGKGVPDLLVGCMDVNYLVEVKDGTLAASRRKLTDDQAIWHRNWKGRQVDIVLSIGDVMRLVGEWRKGLTILNNT